MMIVSSIEEVEPNYSIYKVSWLWNIEIKYNFYCCEVTIDFADGAIILIPNMDRIIYTMGKSIVY